MRLFDPRDLHVGGSGNSNPDAVRPSGETGARCPWCGSEMLLQAGPKEIFEGRKLYVATCKSCLADAPMRDTPEAALAAAARSEEPKP